MNVATRGACYEVTTEDVEYHRADGEPLLARLYRARGDGPFPAAVGIHGGAWTSGDRTTNEAIDRAVAATGAVVAALDFRLAPAAPYPAAAADVNAGIRWLKAHAVEFDSRPDWVGAIASSSGGHLMLLNLLRPNDAVLVAPELASVDASLAFAIACWPIADPLARYRMVLERGNDRLVSAHHAFFGADADRAEDAMTQANPQLILERGATLPLPPLLVLQGTADDNVTPDMAQRLVAAYRAAGGGADLETFENQPHTFATKDPNAPASQRAIALIQHFVAARGHAG
jgi:acetyl esterase